MALTIHEAAKLGDIKAVKRMVKKNAKIVFERSEFNDPPLHLAVDDGQSEVVEFLISKGAKVNDKTEFGWSPLHRAAWKGQMEVAKQLIEHGAKLNAKDNYSQTPLDIATSAEVKKYLASIGGQSGTGKSE